MKCIACDNDLKQKVTSWSLQCERCGYWVSRIKVSQELILNGNTDDSTDPKNIENLESVRIKNFISILDSIKKINPNVKSLLDVGCATGFFIKLAHGAGIDCVGVEPNVNMYNAAKSGPGEIINGFFPDVIKENQKFDVIIFNDVFEHIEDLKPVLNGCSNHLSENGLLVLNLPNSRGILFGLAKFLASIKILTPWNRLWQTMFYTPHLHYFAPNNLNLLLQKYGFFACKEAEGLLTLENKNLWGRLGADITLGLIQRSVYFIVVYPLSWVINIFKSDIFFAIYKKEI